MHFLLKHPVGTIRVDKVQPLGTEAYLHAGLYDFEVRIAGPTMVDWGWHVSTREVCS